MKKMDDICRRQQSLKSVLTCGICKKLCKNVTIIEECCHRFCKKCITRKITEEKLKVCPECNMDLGIDPLQKIRLDHQVQGIRDILSSKRRELIERGLIEKFKKCESKKLTREDIDINSCPNMLIDNPPSPPPPVVIATSSRRKQKSISSIISTAPPLVDDQVSNQHNFSSSSTGRGRGRGRGRRRGNSQNNTNAVCFQDSSKFNNVIDQNKGDTKPGTLTIPLLSSKTTQYKQQIKGDQPGSSSIPLLSSKATQHQQQVESTTYVAESSKKNKSIEPLDEINDLWEPLNKLVTKGVPLDNSNKLSKTKEPVPKFNTPLINLDDYEDKDVVDNDDEEDEEYVPSPEVNYEDKDVVGNDDEEDEEYVPSPEVKEHRIGKLNVVQAIEASSSSNPTNKGKGKKSRRGRKKKEMKTPTTTGGGADGGDNGTNTNVEQARVTIEAATGTNNDSTRVLKERVHPIWFTLVACDKQECPSPLPQISSRYIKIKDVNISTSYIKKYLAQKLSLQSEDEVEVRMLGMPICPSLPLKHLAELWLRATPNSGKKIAKVGASAQEFIMVLKYSRSHHKLTIIS